MYRSIVCRAVRPAGRRNFVSTVLLTRSYETSNVADLKKELKSRGLSSTGNKALLVSRLQEDDNKRTIEAVSTPAQTRQASTVVTPEPTADTAPVPGNPDVAQANRPPPAGTWSTILPDLSQPIPEPPVQIPYLPDFWESSAKAASAKNALEQELPKIVVIAGADTHHGGGPSHNLLDAAQALSPEALASPKAEPAAPAPTPKGQGGLWDDIAEDLGLPHPKELKTTFANLFRS